MQEYKGKLGPELQRHLAEDLATGASLESTTTSLGWASQSSAVSQDDLWTLVDIEYTSVEEASNESNDGIAVRYDGVVTGRFDNLVSAFIPTTQIEALASNDKVLHVEKPIAWKNVGLVDNEAYFSLELDQIPGNVTGKGVVIGVLSDSFDTSASNTSSYQIDIDSGDLPSDVSILRDASSSESDEGRAMAQLIHDIAPDADIMFRTAWEGKADFAAGIRELAEAGADIIVDDIIYLDEMMFQDDVVAQAVDEVTQMGVSYFSSAGNNGYRGFDLNYAGTTEFPQFAGGFDFSSALNSVHDFDPSSAVDPLLEILIPPWGQLNTWFQWNNPIVDGQSLATDIDFFLIDENGELLASSATSSRSERIGYSNLSGSDKTAYLVIGSYAGDENVRIRGVDFGGLEESWIKSHTSSFNGSTVYGHAAAAGAMSVGASYWLETPHYGQDPAAIEDFSSSGGVDFYFDKNGTSLDGAGGPVSRNALDFVAADGTSTTFFGSGGRYFFGTSAAAPNAAGVAGLMMEINPTLPPGVVRSLLQETARDMDDPNTLGMDYGWDKATGFGLVDGSAILAPSTLGEQLGTVFLKENLLNFTCPQGLTFIRSQVTWMNENRTIAVWATDEDQKQFRYSFQAGLTRAHNSTAQRFEAIDLAMVLFQQLVLLK